MRIALVAAIAAAATLTACASPGTSSSIPNPAVVSAAQMTNDHHGPNRSDALDCHTKSVYVTESQLFIQGPSGYYDAKVNIQANNKAYRFYSVEVQNQLYPSPILVWDDVDGPGQYTFIPPQTTNQWNLPEAHTVTIMQTSDDISSGGVQLSIESCQPIEPQSHRS